jgi:hypothetical protein
MHFTLNRDSYSPTETLGRLVAAGDLELWTIERPWIEDPDGSRGGKPFESCIPDGDYDLIPYQRSNGDEVWALVNTALGVNMFQDDGDGRYAILIHVGNWVDDVVGCIAPGTGRTISNNRVMVTNSKAAMKKLHDLADFTEQHTLTIRNSMGAVD